MAEKILQSKNRTKPVKNLSNEIDKIYAANNIGKLDLLSSHKDIIEDKLVKIMNQWEEINDNTEDQEEFQNELQQFLQFEEQVLFQVKQLEKVIFGNKGTPIVNQISAVDSRNNYQHPGNVYRTL